MNEQELKILNENLKDIAMDTYNELLEEHKDAFTKDPVLGLFMTMIISVAQSKMVGKIIKKIEESYKV